MPTPSSDPETPPSGLLRPPPAGAERLPGDMLVLTSALMVLASVLWLAVYWSLGQRYSVTITLVFQVATAVTLFLYLRTRRLQLYAVIQLGLILFAPFAMQWSIGSFVTASGVSLWGLLAPVGAVVVLGTRQSAPWMFAWLFMTVVAGAFDYLLAGTAPARVDMQTVSVFFVLNFAAIAVIVYTLLWYYASERQKLQATVDSQREALAAEKGRSDSLLLNILPHGIAERLKQGEPHIADGHADATVLYADVAGFGRLTEALSPVEAVKALNDIFTLFDEVGEKYGVERIKTVGETYLAATGLGGQAAQHADAVANMALEMAERMREYRQPTGEAVALRVGVATGPVVAGVVGRRKFLYDVWGEPVARAQRLAARPRQAGIHVDGVTRRRLESRFMFDDRDAPDAAGAAGEPLEAWLLLGRRA